MASTSTAPTTNSHSMNKLQCTPIGTEEEVGEIAEAVRSRSSLCKTSRAPIDEPVAEARSCCSCLRRRPPPTTFQQCLVMLRHSERLDYVDKDYKESEEGRAWPHDAPLTSRGVELARAVAGELLTLQQASAFSAVASSPYRRCLETAAEVCKKLDIPLVVDQELGEVWDRSMSMDPEPWRSSLELAALVGQLGVEVLNPPTNDGSLKVFGRPPTWPETLSSAKDRYVVRTQTYIEKSALTEQNFILVTHADALAAALQIFERGFADIHKIDFCARLEVSRKVGRSTALAECHGHHGGVYAARWDVLLRAVDAEIFKAEAQMEKYYEARHLDECGEKQQMTQKRKENRTKTDQIFDGKMEELAARRSHSEQSTGGGEEDEEEPAKATAGARA